MLTRALALALVPVAGLLALWTQDSRIENRESRIAAPTVTRTLRAETFIDFDAVAAEEAEVAAFLAEQARLVAAYLEAMRPKIEVDWARWERLHICEQADSWYAYGYFGNGLRGGGGLGMSDGAWQMAVRAAQARGVTLPPHVLQASPEEQMTAAQAFYDAHGWAWGCRV